MILTLSRVLSDAWTLWRRDRELLVAAGGPFLFLPAFALQLIGPRRPAVEPAGVSLADAVRHAADFTADHLGWFGGVLFITQFGLVLLFTLYRAPQRPPLREALTRAAALWPRFLLAALLVSVPASLGLALLVVPGLLVLGRTMLAGPLIAGGERVGAAAAVARSVTLTGGHTATVTGLAALTLGGRFLLAQPFTLLDAVLRAHGTPNPVAAAMVDGAASWIDMLAQIAAVLVAVATYRALAMEAPSRGT